MTVYSYTTVKKFMGLMLYPTPLFDAKVIVCDLCLCQTKSTFMARSLALKLFNLETSMELVILV